MERPSEEDSLLSTRSRRPPRPMPVIVLADVSGSMQGEKIALLNRSVGAMLRAFADEDSARGEIHVAMVAFGGQTARLHQAMTPASRVSWSDMEAAGRTPLGAAFDVASAVLDDPEAVPVRSFPPTLILVSDGAPTDDWTEPFDALVSSRWGSKALRVAVGIGVDRTEEAVRVLADFGSPGLPVMRADQVHEIPGLFRWVTATVTGKLHEHTGWKAVRLADLEMS
jgi:uncharacterized protein YegL